MTENEQPFPPFHPPPKASSEMDFDAPPSSESAALAEAQIRLLRLLARLVVQELRTETSAVQPLDDQFCDERIPLSCRRRRSKR